MLCFIISREAISALAIEKEEIKRKIGAIEEKRKAKKVCLLEIVEKYKILQQKMSQKKSLEVAFRNIKEKCNKVSCK